MTNKRTAYVVDFQGDFVMSKGLLSVPGAESLIGPMNDYLGSLSTDTHDEVVFSYDTHPKDEFIGSPENLGDESKGIPGFPLHCELGTPGWMLACDTAHIRVPKFEVRKNVFNVWEAKSPTVRPFSGNSTVSPDGFRISLEQWAFGLLVRNNSVVEVSGVASDYCVFWAIEGFVSRGIRVEIMADLTKGIGLTIEEVYRENWSENPLVTLK